MEIERVAAIHPLYGQRVVVRDDLAPQGFSVDELHSLYSALMESAHDYNLLMEPPTFAEVDDFLNPGSEQIPPEFVLEAIVVDKFSRTERRMSAVVRVLNKYLEGQDIRALPPVVGEPRKSGSFAYVTVQLPFSDGQVVSVIFHSPEGDKKQIGPADSIIAFRWLLNKRDITQAVAPEGGAEVSLETIGKRITQLVVKNSARFVRTQKDAAEERRALEDTQAAVRAEEDRERQLMAQMADAVKEAETIDAKLSNTLALLEKQKAINAELQAKIDALRQSGAGGAATGARSVGQAGQIEKWLRRENASATEVFSDGFQSGKYAQNPYLLTSQSSDAFVLGVWAKQNGKRPPAKIAKSRGATWRLDDSLYVVDGEKVVLKSGPGLLSDTSNNSDSPEYVRMLQDIVNGAHDADTDKVDSLLDKAAALADADGRFDEFEELFNQAADRLTMLLKKKVEGM